jgi:hypothetical protein
LAELGVPLPADDALSGGTLEATASLFEAAVDLRRASGPRERWHIRQDARVWRD